jgi:hypothetical protein
MLKFLKLVCLACFWYSLGVFLYLKLDRGNLGFLKKIILNVIQRLNFFELFLILFVVYCLFSFFLQLVLFNILGELVNLGLDPNWVYATQPTGTEDSIISKSSSSSNVSGLSKASDGAIMTAALAGGMKMANKMPNIAGKVAAVAGSVAMGAGAIVAKNVAGNVSENTGKNIIKSNLSPELISKLSEFFNLTGNSVLDLLTLIQFFQSCQMTFIILIIYYLILYFIKESIIENILIKILPTKIVSIFMKSLSLFKKSGLILITCFFILLIASTYLSIHYLDFFVTNFDKICDMYINTKK